ncbi:GNAT family N-acetyltransferase [Actinocatenispora rupis]|uniref:N-acetyltransferase domain-containing protein n=1 Tax=Actinocatenispora rupis TaxID=519421 RepID=A0A8J3J5K5_9ACTN|nr:GNAT family N-acetyltransferase [Actinocatenispora rupis]GID14543.1 hypothetical protein Aru02nite_54320 [Actinocatenispora rupis]
MAGYGIRTALAADAAAVHALRARAIRISAAGYYAPDALADWASSGSEDALRRKITTADGVVAVLDGRVVGWACLDGAEVDQLYVDPDHGGRGVARLLYAAIEHRATARGVRTLTAVASLRSAPVFLRFGFTEVRREARLFHGYPMTVVDVTKHLG